jgi:hypothetical protein
MLGFDEQGNSKKSKVIDMVRTRLNNLDGARKDALALQTEEDKKVFNDLEGQYFKNKDPKVLARMESMTIRNPNLGSPKTIDAIRKDAEAEAEYTDNVVKLKDEIRRGKFDTWDQVLARGVDLGVSRKSLNKHVYGVFANKSEAYADDVINQYVDMVSPSGNKQIKANKYQAVKDQIELIRAENEEYNKSVGKNEKPTRTAEIAASLIDKKQKTNAARSLVNQNRTAYENFAENKDIKLELPPSLKDDDAYNLFKANVMRSNYKNKDEIIKYVNAVRKAEQDEANIK